MIVGCGDVGKRIARALNHRWRVLATARSETAATELRSLGVLPIAADLDQPKTLRRAARLAHWVLYLAPPPTQGSEDPRLHRWLTASAHPQRAHPRRTRHQPHLQPHHQPRRSPAAPYSRVFDNTPPRRLVYLSTTGVYGDRAGAWVDETTPVAPRTPRAQRRADAEQQIRAVVRRAARLGRRGWRASILRVPGIYAADRLPIERLTKRLPVAEGDGDGFTNHIHADDLAALTRLALLRGRTNRILNTVDESALTIGAWLDLVADATGLERAPRVPREALAGLLSPMMMSFLEESRRIKGRRFGPELRTKLRWPDVAGFLQTLRPSHSEH